MKPAKAKKLNIPHLQTNIVWRETKEREMSNRGNSQTDAHLNTGKANKQIRIAASIEEVEKAMMHTAINAKFSDMRETRAEQQRNNRR